MIRAKYIIRAYKKYRILENVEKMGSELEKLLEVNSLRRKGLLLAFDFNKKEERDCFWHEAFKQGLLVLRTGEKTIRLRPPLSVKEDEILKAAEIINQSYKKAARLPPK